jgi:hypothetical protein
MPDRQFDVLRNLIKGKGYSLLSAAKKMGKSRQTVYTQLNKVPLEEEFVKEVKKALDLDFSGFLNQKHAIHIKSGQETVDKSEYVKLQKENIKLKKDLSIAEKTIKAQEKEIKELTAKYMKLTDKLLK